MILTSLFFSTSFSFGNIASWGFILILVASIFITRGFLKRTKKAGCLAFGYVGIVVFTILQIALLAWGFLISTSVATYDAFNGGKTYDARVIDVASYTKYDSDKERDVTMYTPTIAFVTTSGDTVTEQLDVSSSSYEMGEIYYIRYNQETGTILTLGYTLVLKFVGSLLFVIIGTSLGVGAALYAAQKPMDQFWHFMSILGFYILCPILMIGFDVLLIYGLFYIPDAPLFAKCIMGFFAFVLTLAIWGYLSNLIKKGAPKVQQVGFGKWSADWEDEPTANKRKKDKQPKNDSGTKDTDNDNPFIIR